eukprot:TRINITY_DN11322_c0_g1::TRINITY_DN11322_c0_g1_i1::g.26390::m.26390 TRINITY_DN11322_c0_g1::TRINITY_DN11322_c0_g1_i1::g.26390  ORF type:complete len:140 (-),score=8.54,sp/Q9SK39/SBP3_ARATH/48.45/4e-26,Cyt-b5/PF00173.23/6.5e-13 TRINITY_DN11322_c0_g1_i1:214-633(-)
MKRGFFSGSESCDHSCPPSSAPACVTQPAKVTPVDPASLPTMTRSELSNYTGANDGQIYIAMKGIVYDVTNGASFYRPGGAYNVFAGKDATRAMALMSTDPKDAANPSLDGLQPKHLKTLEEWIQKYQQKYPMVARLED